MNEPTDGPSCKVAMRFECSHGGRGWNDWQDFAFRGMHIHIDGLRFHLEKQVSDGMLTLHERRVISLPEALRKLSL
jgi:hypothetical protein